MVKTNTRVNNIGKRGASLVHNVSRWHVNIKHNRLVGKRPVDKKNVTTKISFVNKANPKGDKRLFNQILGHNLITAHCVQDTGTAATPVHNIF